MSNIKNRIRSDKRDVMAFLEKLRKIMEHSHFDIDKDLTLIRARKRGREKYSTPYTLLDLDYDISDVADRLMELTVGDYSETVIDKDDDNPPLLFVFGKQVNNKQVYIKLKIKGDPPSHIVCVSFHYAEHDVVFAYT